MAQGDNTPFDEISIGRGENYGTDSFSMILITSLPSATQTTPDRSDFTECTAGGSYSTGGIALTTTYTLASRVLTFDFTNSPEWAAAAGSPTNIVAGLIVNNTVASNDAVAFVDLTTDAGITPISMVSGKVKIDANPQGVFALTLN